MRGVLFDMDGVLYNSEEPIPGRGGDRRLGSGEKHPAPFRDEYDIPRTRCPGAETGTVRHLHKTESDPNPLHNGRHLVTRTRKRTGGFVRHNKSPRRVSWSGLPPGRSGDRSAIRGDRRFGRCLEFPCIEQSIPAPALQSWSRAHCARHDEILARPRWPSARRGAFHRGARACHRTQSAGFRKTGPPFFPVGR